MFLSTKFYLIIGLLTTIFITIKEDAFLLISALGIISLWVAYLLIRLNRNTEKREDSKNEEKSDSKTSESV